MTLANFEASSFNGAYSLVSGATKNGRPVYKHATATQYIFFITNEGWWMGNDYLQDGGFLRTQVTSLYIYGT